MHFPLSRRGQLFSPLLILAFAATSVGQTAQSKPTLKPDDFKVWERLVGPQISNDGHWLSYGVALVDGDGRLVIKNSDTAQILNIPNGVGAKFSEDSQYAAYLITPPKAVLDAIRNGPVGGPPGAPAAKAPQSKLGLRNLATGQEIVFEGVSNFGFLKDTGFLWMQRPATVPLPNGPTAEFVLVNLKSGEPMSISNVANIATNKSQNLVALTIEAESGYKSLQLLDPKAGTLRTLVYGKEAIKSVLFADKSDALSAMVAKEDPKKDGDNFTILVIPNPKASKLEIRALDSTRKTELKGLRIADFAGVDLNDDGTVLAFGTQPWKDKVKPEGRPQDKPGVEVWNAKDVRTMPEQKVQAESVRHKTLTWIWRLADDSVRSYGDGKDQDVRILKDFEHVVITDSKPYDAASTNGFNYEDTWVVNSVTGEKKKVIEKSHWPVVPSRTGRFLAFYERKNWWLYDIKADKKINATGTVRSSFENTDDDHTVPEKPSTSSPLWLRNDDGLVVSDKYDAYLFRTGINTVTQLTQGRKEKRQFRLLNSRPYEEDGAKLTDPMYFVFLDEMTKLSGFYSTDTSGTGKLLFSDNVSLGGYVKSKDTDRVIFTMESFEKSPNLFLTNTAFTAAKVESKTNPQQSKFAWGKTELIHYKNRWGVELQGILTYPADYRPGVRYPMVTYIYERLSQSLNRYEVPVEWSSYNIQALSQNGYFVFQPDIVYKGRNPGINAVDCLEPAVAAVLAKNVGVNPDKIGLMGHSWGGYQTAFVTTVSKVFAVGVAGAPLTELTSMYNTHYWNAGITNQVLLETGQGRLEVPFWEDPKVYFDNSAVWQSKKRTAPILVTFGDKDGAVDYHQGIALYNTLRRMGKDCVLLVYANENHGLAIRANQLDYARRVRHYLDVYLKGVKPEPWISEGVPFVK